MTWTLKSSLRSLAASAGRAWGWARAAATRAVTAAARLLAEAAGVLLGDAVADPAPDVDRPHGDDRPGYARAGYDPGPWDDRRGRASEDEQYEADGYVADPYDTDHDRAGGYGGPCEPLTPPAPTARPRAAGAIAAGAAAARWWVARRGSAWGAAAVGLLAAAAVLAGGPVARVAAALAGLVEM